LFGESPESWVFVLDRGIGNPARRQPGKRARVVRPGWAFCFSFVIGPRFPGRSSSRLYFHIPTLFSGRTRVTTAEFHYVTHAERISFSFLIKRY
jgi:hypothetical protein